MKTGHAVWFIAIVLVCGCQSSRHARLSAEYLGSSDEGAAPVTVRGNVRYSTVLWTDGLTVARAIVAAEYVGAREPGSIVVRRQGDRFFVSVTRLLQGIVDPWLEPGDVVELYTSDSLTFPYDFERYRRIVLEQETESIPDEQR